MQDNAYLILEYMKSEGFNPDNYERVLELLQTVPESISKFLDNQYLLSKKVDYQELELHMMEGANGYITSNGILVPKSVLNDEHFLYNAPKVSYKRHVYNYPTIDEFGVIIFFENWISTETVETIIPSFRFDKDKFYGFIIDKSEKETLRSTEEILKTINSIYDGCKVSHDSISKYDKEVYLMKRQK